MNNALELRGLTKRYPDFTLDGLDLTLPSGCVMGLVGENGAGKSTTIKLILGMLRPDGGQITILGKDGQADVLTKEDLGVVLDEVGLPEWERSWRAPSAAGRAIPLNGFSGTWTCPGTRSSARCPGATK